ncbi:zinc finger protein 2-like [Folsomia candida]|nr:zinc finger protein 2-like [Folsomia candida]XP_035701488.1 zinc finger protein 2-like [Folsomia candida]
MDHTQRAAFECPNCSKMFKTKSAFTQHLVTHDPNVKVKCQICGKISKNPALYSTHLARVHSDRERPSCDICDRVFFSRVTLRKHRDTVHTRIEGRARFPCKIPGCGKTYLNKGSLWSHVKAEHGENKVRFGCTLCPKEFKNRTDLADHIRTHTTEKPFSCPTCGKKFRQRQHLKPHQKTHLDKSARESFPCLDCPAAVFLTKRGLQEHVRAYHEDR